MLIFWGWGSHLKHVADAGISKCPNCKNWAAFELRKSFKQFHVYWIPLARWNKELYWVCGVCEAAYRIPKEEQQAALRESVLLPPNATALNIWNRLQATLTERLGGEGSLDDWAEEAISELVRGGCPDRHARYVMGVYSQYLLELADTYRTPEGTSALPPADGVSEKTEFPCPDGSGLICG